MDNSEKEIVLKYLFSLYQKAWPGYEFKYAIHHEVGVYVITFKSWTVGGFSRGCWRGMEHWVNQVPSEDFNVAVGGKCVFDLTDEESIIRQINLLNWVY